MTLKPDPHHVVHFALEEIGASPDRRHGGNDGRILRKTRFHPKPVIVRQGLEQVNHLEPVLVFRIIHRTDVRQHIEAHFAIVTQEARDVRNGGRLDLRHQILIGTFLPDGEHGIRETVLEFGEQCMHVT